MNELYIDSPIGTVKISLNGKNIVKAVFSDGAEHASDKSAVYYDSVLANKVIGQLSEYFTGKRQEFDLNFSIDSGTEFQILVWQEMLKIPYGQTITYGEIAAKIGKPKAARAVGMACNKNPINIIVPCHRVIGGNGKLTGYAGGLVKKQWLLAHESCIREGNFLKVMSA